VRTLLAFLLAGGLLAATPLALAIPVPGLYEARVPVTDQNPGQREQALRQALSMVLVRLTGSRVLPDSAAAQQILGKASSLVQGYGYETAETGTGLVLHAQFDPRAVQAALRAQGLPVWGDNRLAHLAWIALRDDGSPRAVLDAAGVAARAPAVARAADARGIVLMYPRGDAQDRSRAAFDDVWTAQHDKLLAASQRYNPDQVLIGRVQRESGQWTGRWTLLNLAGQAEDWTVMHDTLDAVLEDGIQQLADREAQRFAVAAGLSAQDLLLQVAGVESLKEYGHVLNYLRGLNPVRSAQLVSVQNGAMVFRLTIDGTPDTIARVLAAGRVLRPESQGLFSSTMNYALVK
jgi:hypothetical protein